jgi:hypothetical protein
MDLDVVFSRRIDDSDDEEGGYYKKKIRRKEKSAEFLKTPKALSPMLEISERSKSNLKSKQEKIQV